MRVPYFRAGTATGSVRRVEAVLVLSAGAAVSVRILIAV
jgi:hypothetical protein